MWGIYLGISGALIHGHLLWNQAYEEFDDFPTFWEFTDEGGARYFDGKGASINDALKVFKFLPPSLSTFSRNLTFPVCINLNFGAV